MNRNEPATDDIAAVIATASTEREQTLVFEINACGDEINRLSDERDALRATVSELSAALDAAAAVLEHGEPFKMPRTGTPGIRIYAPLVADALAAARVALAKIGTKVEA